MRITAVRKLAVEAADNGLLAPELAAGITRVKGAKSKGVRVGNWLSLQQAQTLLNAPDVTTKKGLRDRAMLAVLLGCGLRRSEVAALTLKHIQQRDNRWCIVDLVGKHGRVRTIPMPTWVKVAIDAWTAAAGVHRGSVFRPVSRGDQVHGDGMSEKVVWQLLQRYAAAAGVPGIAPHDLPPHVRQAVPRRRRGTGADPVAAGPRLSADDRAIPWHEAGSGSCTERWDQVEGGGLVGGPVWEPDRFDGKPFAASTWSAGMLNREYDFPTCLCATIQFSLRERGIERWRPGAMHGWSSPAARLTLRGSGAFPV